MVEEVNVFGALACKEPAMPGVPLICAINYAFIRALELRWGLRSELKVHIPTWQIING